MAAYTTAAKVYNRSGLTSSEIDLSTNAQPIDDAEAEIEMITGRKFTDAISITEYFDGPKTDIHGNQATRIRLSFFPLLTITSFLLLDSTGATTSTLDTLSVSEFQSDDYTCESQYDPLNNSIIRNGVIDLKSKSLRTGKISAKVVYTYGYSSVPPNIGTLATCMAGLRAWVQFLGGQFNRLNSYSVPQQTVDKGDFYQRGMQMIRALDKEANELLDRIGRKQRTLFFASGGTGGP